MGKMQSDVSQMRAAKVVAAAFLALVLTFLACVATFSWFEKKDVVLDCLAPMGNWTVSAAAVYYKSSQDTQFSERQKCSKIVDAEELRKNQNHIRIEIPASATECRFDLWFNQQVPKVMPLKFYTRNGEKIHEMKVSPWNRRNSMNVVLVADDFSKTGFHNLAFLSFSTMVFLCVFAICRFVVIHGASVKMAVPFFIAGFVAILIWPTLRMDKSDKSDRENRMLAKFPELIVMQQSGLSPYCKKLEAAFNDRFNGRNSFIGAHSFITSLCDGRGNAKVHRGKDGWLFLRSTLWDFDNSHPMYEEVKLKKIRDYLNDIAGYAKRNGKAFVFFIAPDKCRVYPEKVRFFKKVRPDSESLTEQLVAYLRKECDFPVIYPREMAIQLKHEIGEELYYKGDTHWNSVGAYRIGFLPIMSTLGMSESPAPDSPTVAVPEFWGDLHRMLGVKAEDVYDAKSPSVRLGRIGGRPICAIADDIAISVRNAGKDVGTQVITVENPNGGGRLYCIRDSFGTDLVPHFARVFSRCFFRHRLLGVVAEDYEEIAASDVIVFEIVERDLLAQSGMKFPDALKRGGQ